VQALAVAGSPVQATVSWTRAVPANGVELHVEEIWSCAASRIEVTVTLSNADQEPIELADVRYELGIDPEVMTAWVRHFDERRSERGTMPTGFDADADSRRVDWAGAEGIGLALVMKRCALSTKWTTGYRGIRHSPAETRVALLRNTRLDPADTVLAEFELWPYKGSPPSGQTPTVLTATRTP
jgi:hypothetical protein